MLIEYMRALIYKCTIKEIHIEVMVTKGRNILQH